MNTEPEKGNITRTCEVCGHTGTDVHEYPTYSHSLGRDTTQYQCDDIDACLERSLPKYYRKTEVANVS